MAAAAAAAAASEGMTRITLSFMLSMLSDNYQGPEAPVNSKYHWAYKGPEGPEFWHQHYKYCSGEKQSPIDILSSSSEYDNSLDPVILDHFDSVSASTGPCMLNVTNNGHAASVRIIDEDMRVRGGGLGQNYKTAEFHFHWGSTDDVGSEHSVDGRKYPLEMHVVSFAEKYGTIKQAMTQPDGLAVLAVFFELSDKDNSQFAPLDEALRHISKAGEHTLVNHLRLRSLLPEDLSKFWRYNGSLTTPFCFESVVWTVFSEPQKISKSQLETLRSLLHEDGHEVNDRGDRRPNSASRIMENWRPIQPLNGRVVKRSFGRPSVDSAYKATSNTKVRTEDLSMFMSPNIYRTAAVAGADTLNMVPATRLYPPVAQQGRQATADTRASSYSSHNRPDTPRVVVKEQGIDKYAASNSAPQTSVVNATPPSASGGNVAEKPQNGDAGASLFTQFQDGSYSGGTNTQNNQKQPHSGTASSGNSPKSVNGADHHGQILASAAGEGQGSHPGPRGSPPGQGPSQQITGVSNQQGQESVISSASSPQPHSEKSWAAVSERHQQQPNHAPLQKGYQQQQSHASNPVKTIVSIGQIEHNLQEFAHHIMSHRHHGSTQHSATPTNGKFLPMPPVIRHNQPLQQNSPAQQTIVYSPAQQYREQQQQPRNPQHKRPATAQHLREILQKLAATRRATPRTGAVTSGARTIPSVAATITSGAASVPYVPANVVNYRGGLADGADQYPTGMLMDGSSHGKPTLIHSWHSSNPHPSYLDSPPRQISWGSQPADASLIGSSRSLMLLHRPYSQQQQLESGYQQQHHPVQNQYPTWQQDAVSIYNPNIGNTNPETFISTGPAELRTPQDSIYGRGFSATNEQPPVFLHALNQPVGIQRPLLENNPWRQRQYQTPQSYW